ncbi:putative short-chain dehydrogenases/reductase [Mollisia scopiformis]|uniref:Putative short-chain dehydrogenases/reductase n=1 Tax=Mollisia scopiformis TaxID=149040 RepID=A0A194X740_MOLSC|nr:putative short-chain dehydrogenases/reductase [Mollisia scopiformis]KUJ15988.1 putative short-chain dehydrogenases/reductase [Mollisia scopiformis]
MASYVVTGTSTGIGLGFVKALAANKDNKVFAIIRNPATATDLQTFADSHPNVRIIVGEATSKEDMDRAAEEVGKVTGGKLDALINNVGGGSVDDAKAPRDYEGNPQDLKNAILASMEPNFFSAVFTTSSFMPLIQAGEQKKIICISTGMADDDMSLKTDIPFALGYAASKSALNTLVAKFAIDYKKDGVKFLALSPGWVKTKFGPESEMQAGFMLQAFQKAYPELKGQISTEDSVKMQLEVIDKLTLEDSGKFLSHHGDKYWV